MAYIDENLLQGEKLAHTTTLHWIIFLKPFLLFIFSFIVMILIWDADIDILKWIYYGLYIISFGLASIETIKLITTEFGVTNKRVIIKKGIIQRDSLEIFLHKVSGIQVNQKILGRIFNFGTIIISGTGGNREYFDNINDPLKLRRSVQEQVELNQK